MARRRPVPTRTFRIRKLRAAGVLLVTTAIVAGIGYESLASSSPAGGNSTDVLRTAHRVVFGGADRATSLGSDGSGALGEADGAVPDGTTVFDDRVPGLARLDPALLGALRRAATDAA